MRKYTTHAAFLALGAIFVLASVAEAQPGGWGKKGRMGRRGGCGLMMAQPAMLKAKLGLDDAQIQKIQKIWYNMASKAIKTRAEVQQLRLKKRMLMQTDLPDENKVLALHRKIRSLRGKMSEEKIKSRLKVLRTLTKQQRTKYRAMCPRGMGHGNWGRMGRRGGRGGHGGGYGKGMGQQGGGWGGGGW